jgi:hypothetical protein
MKVVEESSPSRVRVEKDARKPDKLPRFFGEQYQSSVGLAVRKPLLPMGKPIFVNLMVEEMVREYAAVRFPPAIRMKFGDCRRIGG